MHRKFKGFKALPSLLPPQLPSWLSVSVLETSNLPEVFFGVCVSPVVVIAFKKVCLCVFFQYDLT